MLKLLTIALQNILPLHRTCTHLKGHGGHKFAVATMNRWFGEAGLEQHPGKTFIGRIERGFDWLGYRFDAAGLRGVATRTMEQATLKLHRLLEQAARRRADTTVLQQAVAEYQTRWQRWLFAGLRDIIGQAKPWDVKTPEGIVVL